MRPRLCLTLFITLAPPLLAQQAGPSTGAAEWRDSVGMWSDERLRSTLAQSPQGADPETRLRRGWVLEISGTRFDSVPLLLAAMNEFYEVTVRRSKWVEGWYGLGMAKTALLAEGAREIRSPHQTAGTGWAQGAANAFLQAQRVDPPFLPAAVALAKISPELRDQTSAVEIQRRLERAVAMNGSDPSLWVLVADAATRRGDDSAAVTALMKAQSLLGAPSGPILLALARAHFALGDPAAGADEYYRGAALPDSATRASYRYDVGLVADSAELAAFDATTADQFPAWLREFWGKRERESGRPPGSRLVEHERRYRYAREHFATIPRTFRQYGFDEPYRDAPAGIDDRGAVYVRHGSRTRRRRISILMSG